MLKPESPPPRFASLRNLIMGVVFLLALIVGLLVVIDLHLVPSHTEDRSLEVVDVFLSESRPPLNPTALAAPGQDKQENTIDTAAPQIDIVQGRMPQKDVIWTTLVDEDTDFQVLKRHLVSKFVNGNVDWGMMSVLAMPKAAKETIAWAEGLGIAIQRVSAPLGGLHAWCAKDAELVVFMTPNTVVRRNVRRLVDTCAGEADFCGAAAGSDGPAFRVDPGVFVARPSDEHCAAFTGMVNQRNVSRTLGILEQKMFLDKYFGMANRKLVDARYNDIIPEKHTVHRVQDAIVVQYDSAALPGLVPPNTLLSSEVRDMITHADMAVEEFESLRQDIVPASVLYVTLLTPSPANERTHSTTPAFLKEHHYSKFHFGKIPWANQAIIYTENAFPEYRAWLESKGGKAIEVPPLLCSKGREARYLYQYTKLQFWNLTAYDYIVYTDLDVYITGDISKLWSSCVDGVPLCAVPESIYMPKDHYFNGGVLVVRPDAETYKLLVDGRQTYTKDEYLCEQDFLNFFLERPRIGLVDPKYNVMSFDSARKVRLSDARIVHFKWKHLTEARHYGKLKLTREERIYMRNLQVRIQALIAADEGDPPSDKIAAVATDPAPGDGSQELSVASRGSIAKAFRRPEARFKASEAHRESRLRSSAENSK